MTNYAFVNMPGHGHVNPTLAVVQELVARGEQVSYYLTEDFRAIIEAMGVTFRSYHSQIGQIINMNLNAMDNGNMSAFFQAPGFMIDEATHVLPQVLETLRAEQPDYIVYDGLCVWARIAARALNLPTIRLFPSYAANEHFSVASSMMATLQQNTMGNGIAAIMGQMNEKLAELCRTYHVELLEIHRFFQGEELLNIVFLPKEFQPEGQTFDERFVFVGPSIQTRSAADAFPFEKLGKQPLVYISLGTVFDNQAEFYNRSFVALQDTPWQVLLAYGKRVDTAALNPAPPNFLIASYVPQLEILARSSVFVTHGGMNSTMESLYYGVPVVVIPQMPEQLMTARRVQELGLGVMLDKNTITAEQLRTTVEQVMNDPTYRTRVQNMQRHIQNAGGYKRAVDAIMHFASA
jgi:MGT family glycosyltransferase